MGPRDIDLVRVWTRVPGTLVADMTFPVAAAFEVVVDAEAGASFIPPPAPTATFGIGVYVRDLSTGLFIPTTPIPPTPVPFAPTLFGAPAWPTAKQQFAYTIAAADLAGRANHVCDVLAVLTVTPTVAPFDPDVSFVTSPMFMITP